MNSSRKILALLLLAFALLSFAGTSCRNTVSGVGRDVEKMGDRVERAT